MSITSKLTSTVAVIRQAPPLSPFGRGLSRTFVLLSTLAAACCLTQALSSSASAASASPAHGAQVFVESGCSHCHGPAGSGGDRGPDLKNIAHRMTAEKMATQIHDGGQSMPPFGEVLAPQDITDVVAYLRAKRKPPIPSPHESAPASQ